MSEKKTGKTRTRIPDLLPEEDSFAIKTKMKQHGRVY